MMKYRMYLADDDYICELEGLLVTGISYKIVTCCFGSIVWVVTFIWVEFYVSVYLGEFGCLDSSAQ